MIMNQTKEKINNETRLVRGKLQKKYWIYWITSEYEVSFTREWDNVESLSKDRYESLEEAKIAAKANLDDSIEFLTHKIALINSRKDSL